MPLIHTEISLEDFLINKTGSYHKAVVLQNVNVSIN